MKITRFAAYIMLILTVLLPAFTACLNMSPFEQVLVCSEVAKDGEPVKTVESVVPDIDNIYCSVKLVSTSDKSNIKAEWKIVKSEDGQYSDYLIGNETIAASTKYVVLGFVRSDKLLPIGDYEVKLYYDDKFVQSVPFKVMGEASVSTAILTEATMCTGIDLLENKPLDKVTVFPNDSAAIYCSVKVTGASFATVVKARWTYLDGELEGLRNKTIYTASSKVEGKQYMSFSLGMAEGKNFPIGNYELALLIEDKEQANLQFKVVSPAEIPGPFISDALTLAYTDKEKNTVDITGKFASSIEEIWVNARIYNAPAGTELGLKWVLVRSDDAIYADQLLKEDKVTIEGTTPIFAAFKRGEKEMIKGDYAVIIALDGKDKVTLPFRVK